ncbi:uncharacterized protein MELLADRAFT_105343 [Melampsora larici-populina 98AG31]|uniref:Uncharacterized protein n=1 Tax=Melampsora larici-populina (strain 98AG31 / pathotype 3-4-7) TaxID=747676 RepID=F4RHT8_MELLP|nr:uncharacterized protein MELLADRAFT_105343 [Melampsora larici-populina 98AG31]EGG08078.1 hypothetical protein MELLADRAFT_105343 [Melampsora larici-populina 98AG31]
MSFQLQLEQTNRVLTRANAAATGVQPGNRLITPKRGGNGRRSVTSQRTPTGDQNGRMSGIKKYGQRPKGLRKTQQELRKKKERRQVEPRNEREEELQAVEEEMEEWGGIGSGNEEGTEEREEEEQGNERTDHKNIVPTHRHNLQ